MQVTLRPFVALAALLAVHAIAPTFVAAQSPGNFFTFGNGCAGTGAGLGEALSLNSNATATQLGGNSNQFAFKALNTTPAPIVVLGFELWTNATGSDPVTLTTELYDEATPGGAPNTQPIRTGTMTVSNKLAWYRTTFATPHVLMPQTAVFLSFLGTPAILHPRAQSGATRGIHYYHSPTSTTWNGPYTTQAWAWRVLSSVSTGARPTIGASTVPTIGQPFQVTLANARPGTLVALTIGGSNASWGTLTLPFDLTPIGMPGCRLLASPDLVLAFASDPTGAAAYPLVVPNDPTLLAQRLYHQWLVIDAGANALGIVVSDAAEGRLG